MTQGSLQSMVYYYQKTCIWLKLLDGISFLFVKKYNPRIRDYLFFCTHKEFQDLLYGLQKNRNTDIGK